MEKVGTAVGQKDQNAEKLEAGKRVFVKIEDADLAILEGNETVPIKVRTSEGDEETVECLPVGRNVRVVLGSIPTRLGKARKGNGIIEVTGRHSTVSSSPSEVRTFMGTVSFPSRIAKSASSIFTKTRFPASSFSAFWSFCPTAVPTFSMAKIARP
jgi:hypothetical protein